MMIDMKIISWLIPLENTMHVLPDHTIIHEQRVYHTV